MLSFSSVCTVLFFLAMCNNFVLKKHSSRDYSLRAAYRMAIEAYVYAKSCLGKDLQGTRDIFLEVE